MSRVVEIDEAIREAEEREQSLWAAFVAKILVFIDPVDEAAAYRQAMSATDALRAARARGETHVTVEDE